MVVMGLWSSGVTVCWLKRRSSGYTVVSWCGGLADQWSGGVVEWWSGELVWWWSDGSVDDGSKDWWIRDLVKWWSGA